MSDRQLASRHRARAIGGAAVASGLRIAQRLIQQEWNQRGRPWFSFNYNRQTRRRLAAIVEEVDRDEQERQSRASSSSVGRSSEYQSPESDRNSRRSSQRAERADRNRMQQENDNDNMDTSDPNVQGNPAATVATTGGGSRGGSGGGVRGQAFLPPGLPIQKNSCVKTYTKNYRFRIQNAKIQYKTGSTTTPTPDANSYVVVRYPYHDLPVKCLGFWLLEEEIHKIMTECTAARVLNAECEIYNHIANLPFETAGSTVTLANNNVGISLCQINPKINKYRVGTLNGLGPFIEERCWGKHPSDLPVQATEWSDNLGELSAQYVTKDLDMRFEYASLTGERTDRLPNAAKTRNRFNFKEPFFPVNNFIINQINASFTEGPFMKWEYTPKDGNILLNTGRMYGAFDFNNQFTRGMVSTQQMPLLESSVHVPGAGYRTDSMRNALGRTFTQGETEGTMRWLPWAKVTRTEYSVIPIENEFGMEKKFPACCFGIYPKITGNWTGVNVGDLVNAQIEVEVKCMIQIEETYGNNYQHHQGGNVVQPDRNLPWRLGFYDDTREVVCTPSVTTIAHGPQEHLGLANTVDWALPGTVVSLDSYKKSRKETEKARAKEMNAWIDAGTEYETNKKKKLDPETYVRAKHLTEDSVHTLRSGRKYEAYANMKKAKIT